jgi:HK97 family phage prohead protease
MKNYLTRPFEVKAESVTATGAFEGIASPFGEIDAGRDIVMRGAFKNSLEQFKAKKRKVPMLWQHNTRQPIGVYTSLKETETGLEVVGQCNMKVQAGQECHALMEQGALTGLSIGYDPIKTMWDEKQEVRSLIELDLWEISPVTFPMADGGRVALVKSLEEAGNLSDCEALLRDAGFSKSEALAFVSRVKALAMQHRGDPDQPSVESIKRASQILSTIR